MCQSLRCREGKDRAACDIQTTFARIVEKVTNVDWTKVAGGMRIREDLGIDSLSLIEVAVAAEDAFKIRIPDEDLEHFQTIYDAVEYIRRATLVM